MIKILQFGEGDFLRAFANSVIERFNNPFIDHKLLDISLNSVAKFKARCLCLIIIINSAKFRVFYHLLLRH